MIPLVAAKLDNNTNLYLKIIQVYNTSTCFHVVFY
jgi:hypothetical protein